MNFQPVIIILYIITSCQSGQSSNTTVPVKVTVNSTGQCLSNPREVSVIPNFGEAILTYLGYLNTPCNCSSNNPNWTQVADLDMTDSSQSCPSAWSLATRNGVRACGRPYTESGSCNSVFYSAHSRRYSQVCGRIKGYQHNTPDAFFPSITANISIDSWYAEGVSLTHGLPGSRTHIWTFVNAFATTIAYDRYICPCTLADPTSWPHSVPSFVGNNFFCDTAYTNRRWEFNTNNPLWDGEGCTGDNTCCQFNRPPWFCRTLPAPTTDDLEVRICGDSDTYNENIYISNIELSVR